MGEAAENLPLGVYADAEGESQLQSVPSANDASWDAVYADVLRESLCLFAKDILKIEIGPHLVEWDDLVASSRRVALNAARDHSKSTFFSYAYPIWRVWGDPGCEVYLFSATLEQAIEFLDIILYGRDNLKGMIDIPELAHLVPTREDFQRDPKLRLNRQDVRFTNGSRIRVLGYGKKTRGRHPKYIVLDDVLNDEDMYSETVRRKHIDYYKSAIVNMAHPEGQIVNVGTPYHAADLWGWFKKNSEYNFRRYPGIYTDSKGDERALFPWRWTVDALKGKKREIGSVAFTREILCQPISDDLSIFPSVLFPPLYDKTLTLRPTRKQLRERGITCYAGVDIAISASVAADYFVVFIIGVDGHGNRYLVDIYRSKGDSFNKQLEVIEKMCRRYDVALCHIEANQMQRVWSDELRRTTDIPVKPFTTLATNKYPLDKGVPGLRIILENTKLVIPKGDAYSRRVTGIWEEEAMQFGFVDGKLQGAGEHDDTVMAWWMAEEAAKAGGFSFSIGDEDGDEEAMAEMMGEGEEGGESWQDVFIGGDDDEQEDDDMEETFQVPSTGFEAPALDPFGI